VDDTRVVGGSELAALAQLAFALAGLAREQVTAAGLAEQHLAVLRLLEALGQALARFMFHFVTHKKLRSSARVRTCGLRTGRDSYAIAAPPSSFFPEKNQLTVGVTVQPTLAGVHRRP